MVDECVCTYVCKLYTALYIESVYIEHVCNWFKKDMTECSNTEGY